MERVLRGVCGAAASWELDLETGKMVIRGKGPMTDYEGADEAPWHPYREQISEAVLEEGITTLADYAFTGCKNMERFTLASSVEILGTYGLSECTALEEAVIPEGVRVIGAKTFSASSGIKKVSLPVSVKAIDMKAFEMEPELSEVVYAGTRAQWKQIRISSTASGNKYLLNASITYAGADDSEELTEELEPADEKKECIPVFEMAREAVRQGGDGKLHILSVDLTTPNIPSKPGDCTIFIFPDGQTMMLDAGINHCEERVLNALRSLELTSLDYFAVSHPHSDHVGNAMSVAKYIYGHGGKIGTYFYMGFPLREMEPALSAYLQEQGVDMQNHLRAGDVRQIGGVKMEIFGPSDEKYALGATMAPVEINSLSLIMKFTFGGASYMTSGDLYRNDEREAIEAWGSQLRSTVMKANHHGAYTSNGPEWLEAVDPALMIIQCDDIGGTVLSERAAAMGIEYYSVGLDGSVLVTMDKDGTLEAKTAYGKELLR